MLEEHAYQKEIEDLEIRGNWGGDFEECDESDYAKSDDMQSPDTSDNEEQNIRVRKQPYRGS